MKTLHRTKALVALLGGVGALAALGIRVHQPAQAQSPAPIGKVTPWAAMKIATNKVPGRAINANYEFDEGHWIYGVFVVTGKTIKEVAINPQTGKVGDVETVTPEGEAKEVAQELRAALNGGKSANSPSEKENDEKDGKDEQSEKP